MNRKDFIKSIIGITTMTTLGSFKQVTDTLEEQDLVMPVLFIGHGSPMNAIEENEFTQAWQNLGKSIPKPKAILCISAHWETKGTYVTAMEKPSTIHDFGGFPQALFDTQYPAPGSLWLANQTKEVIKTTPVEFDQDWGLDHGCWSIMKQMYPEANIPIIQMSLDYTKNAQYHFDLSKQLAALRKKGVLIIGSGNMVHNFKYAQWNATKQNPMVADWALEANETFKNLITNANYNPLIDYQKNKIFQLAAPTPEHYLPMLYSIALRDKNESLSFFNDSVALGAFSMTSIKIG